MLLFFESATVFGNAANFGNAAIFGNAAVFFESAADFGYAVFENGRMQGATFIPLFMEMAFSRKWENENLGCTIHFFFSRNSFF